MGPSPRPRVGARTTDRDRSIRLPKFLSRAGVASRRGAERIIAAGRVSVNGVVVVEPGRKIDPDRDRVEVDGRRVSVAPPRWIALHKPPGVLTTKADPQRRRTVYHLLPSELRALRYVGRLDRGTEGLLLLTNQGDLAQELLLPRNGVEREYRTLVAGIPSPATLRALTHGVELEDGTARARTARIVRTVEDRATLALVLTEGRKREVRRMLRAVGHPVLRLKRVRFGPVRLSRLPRGQWRDLTETEVAALEDAVAPGPGPSGRRS